MVSPLFAFATVCLPQPSTFLFDALLVPTCLANRKLRLALFLHRVTETLELVVL